MELLSLLASSAEVDKGAEYAQLSMQNKSRERGRKINKARQKM